MTERVVRMNIHGQVAVVTGAARGIGRAIAEKLVAEGAHVVINDLDADELTQVAAAIGATAAAGDAASEDGVSALIDATQGQFGRVDMYFGNAGVPGLGDVDASEAQWSHTLEVNLLAHVRAARILIPRWLERGAGRFVVTASAAGLLSMPGAAPYAASKHALVGFAEWLALTYGDRGIVVQCICPQGVATQMLDQMGEFGGAAVHDGTLTPAEVAEQVWRGLSDDRMLILPHPEVRGHYIKRATDTDRWLRGIRTLLPKH